MGELVLRAARELGIDSHVRVLEDHQINPLVTVRVGAAAVQSRIEATWFLDSSLTDVKTILNDMLNAATNR
jgi:hypothetical protein